MELFQNKYAALYQEAAALYPNGSLSKIKSCAKLQQQTNLSAQKPPSDAKVHKVVLAAASPKTGTCTH